MPFQTKAPDFSRRGEERNPARNRSIELHYYAPLSEARAKVIEQKRDR